VTGDCHAAPGPPGYPISLTHRLALPGSHHHTGADQVLDTYPARPRRTRRMKAVILGSPGHMTDSGHGELLHPGQKAPVSGFYECDCGQSHGYSTDVAGHILPPLPHGCSGRGWRLAQARP
jgi:hypothetical protein